MSEFPISYEQTPADFHGETRIDFHVGNERLLNIDAARELTRVAHEVRKIERQTTPLQPHELSAVVTRNVLQFRNAEQNGDNERVNIEPTERPTAQKDFDLTA